MNRADAITAAELHERYLKEVFRYVLQRVTTIEEAEDITAEVFAAAATGLSRFRGECAPHLWLLSIARRQIARAHRRKAARRETFASELAGEAPEAPALWEALAAVEGPEAAVLGRELAERLRQALGRLSEREGAVFCLRYFEDLSYQQIADALHIRVGAVAAALHKARARLETLLPEAVTEE